MKDQLHSLKLMRRERERFMIQLEQMIPNGVEWRVNELTIDGEAK